MKRPLVSIVSPIYGVEKYIGECLESMFKQTYPNIEYVFVNDKTPDNSMEILEEMIKKFNVNNVNVINHKKNLGLCGVRNTGLKATHGEYIMIVDSDDKLPLNAVETLVQCALDNDADYVESDFAFYTGHIGKVYKRYYDGNRNKYISSFLAMVTAPAIWGKLYNKSLFSDIDYLFVVGRDNVEDVFSTPILADRAKKIAYTNQVTYYYRIDNPNAYSKKKYVNWSKIDDMVYSVRKHEEHFKNNNIYLEAIKEKKYWIVTYYYLKLQEKNDRQKLALLYPENDNYIKSKPVLYRINWFCLKHDLTMTFSITYKLIKILKKIYGIKECN